VTRNQIRGLSIGAALVAFLAILLAAWNLAVHASRRIECADGTRRTIDLADFRSPDWAYRGAIELKSRDRELSARLDPVLLSTLSESAQKARDWRLFLVASYNSCAVSKADYLRLSGRNEELATLERAIDERLRAAASRPADAAELEQLIDHYHQVVLSLHS
jgi:hypothetical protein